MLLAVISFSTFHLKSPYEGRSCIFWKPDEIILFYWPFWTIGCWTTPFCTACFSETCYCEASSLRFLLFSAPNFYGKVRTLDPEISSQFFRSYSKCTDTKQILDWQVLWKKTALRVRLFFQQSRSNRGQLVWKRELNFCAIPSPWNCLSV